MDFGTIKQNFEIFIEDWGNLLVIGLILLIPTLVYYMMKSSGYAIPFALQTLAVNSWMKAIVGIGVGILFGVLVNKKYGE
jgi:hypothetical protein